MQHRHAARRASNRVPRRWRTGGLQPADHVRQRRELGAHRRGLVAEQHVLEAVQRPCGDALHRSTRRVRRGALCKLGLQRRCSAVPRGATGGNAEV